MNDREPDEAREFRPFTFTVDSLNWMIDQIAKGLPEHLEYLYKYPFWNYSQFVELTERENARKGLIQFYYQLLALSKEPEKREIWLEAIKNIYGDQYISPNKVINTIKGSDPYVSQKNIINLIKGSEDLSDEEREIIQKLLNEKGFFFTYKNINNIINSQVWWKSSISRLMFNSILGEKDSYSVEELLDALSKFPKETQTEILKLIVHYKKHLEIKK